MKYLLLAVIKMYWFLVPKKKRKKCLFKVSCSHKVYDNTQQFGFGVGIKTLRKRYLQCRPGYTLVLSNEIYKIKLVHGEEMSCSEMSEILLLSLGIDINSYSKSKLN